jgi:hypothetical protein
MGKASANNITLGMNLHKLMQIGNSSQMMFSIKKVGIYFFEAIQFFNKPNPKLDMNFSNL